MSLFVCGESTVLTLTLLALCRGGIKSEQLQWVVVGGLRQYALVALSVISKT